MVYHVEDPPGLVAEVLQHWFDFFTLGRSINHLQIDNPVDQIVEIVQDVTLATGWLLRRRSRSRASVHLILPLFPIQTY